MLKRFVNVPFVAIVGLLLILAACSSQAAQVASPNSSDRAAPPVPIVAAATGVPAANDPTQTRLVLKDASLNLIVEDAAKSAVDIGKMATDMKGWVVNSDSRKVVTGANTYTQASIVVRVPAERLDEAVEHVKAGAISVESEKQTGQDVTQQYTDLQSKITNLEAAEVQLRKIMDNANQTTDVLAVYDQLVRMRNDIQVAKGQAKFYEQSAAFSLINIVLSPKQDSVLAQVRGWSPLDTVTSAISSLGNMLQALINLLIWLLIFVLPLAIIVGVPCYIIYRVYLRQSRRAISSFVPDNTRSPQPPISPIEQ